MIRTVPVAAEMLDLVAAAPPEALMIWAEEGGRRVLTDRQEVDDAGRRLWTCYAMPRLEGQRPEIIQVRVPADVQPVLTVFGAVAFDSLEVRVNVDKAGKLAGYWSARGVRDASAARVNGTTKTAAGSAADPGPRSAADPHSVSTRDPKPEASAA